MSDEIRDDASQADPLANVKAEFNRKLQNQESKLTQIMQTLETVSSKLAPAQPVQEEVIDPYDPDKLLSAIDKKVESRISNFAASQAEQNRVLSDLMTKYPELANPSTDLYQEVQTRIAQAGSTDVNTVKYAVLEAASELGVKPAHKRAKSQSSNENFVLGGSNGGVKGEQTAAKGKSPKISEVTKMWSELLGRPVDSKDYSERMEQILTKRKNFAKWE